MLRQKGSLCEIGAYTDQVSGVDACVQRAAAAKVDNRERRLMGEGGI